MSSFFSSHLTNVILSIMPLKSYMIDNRTILQLNQCNFCWRVNSNYLTTNQNTTYTYKSYVIRCLEYIKRKKFQFHFHILLIFYNLFVIINKRIFISHEFCAFKHSRVDIRWCLEQSTTFNIHWHLKTILKCLINSNKCMEIYVTK